MEAGSNHCVQMIKLIHQVVDRIDRFVNDLSRLDNRSALFQQPAKVLNDQVIVDSLPWKQSDSIILLNQPGGEFHQLSKVTLVYVDIFYRPRARIIIGHRPDAYLATKTAFCHDVLCRTSRATTFSVATTDFSPSFVSGLTIKLYARSG